MNKIKQKLIPKLANLSDHLRQLADEIETLDEPHWQDHADQMRGAAVCANSWVDGLRTELAGNRPIYYDEDELRDRRLKDEG